MESEEDNSIDFDETQARLIAEDKDLFTAADIDNDGYLNLEEFIKFNNPEEYPELLPIVLNQTLKEKDSNDDGKIDFQEFVGDSGRDKDKEYLLTEKDRFDNDYDKDRNGYLQGNEILSWILPSST